MSRKEKDKEGKADREENRNRIFGRIFIWFIGMTAVLTFFSKSLYNYRLPVVTVASPKQGRLETSIAGGKADITPENDDILYDTLLPIAALRQDDKGYYVLTLQADDGVLGNGYKAARAAVDLLDADKLYCAVEGLPEGELVIVEATSEIFAGDHVYYEGGEIYDEKGK